MFAKPFAALLFDMDGTLLDSLVSAERVWGAWAKQRGLDVATFVPTIHGRRVDETLAAVGVVGADAAREAAAITAAELADVDGITPIAGVAQFLKSLPADRWAIVTSAPRALALRRLAAAGLEPPKVLIASEDVTHGKPAPDCYALAARRLGVDVRACLVVEDAPAGIKAGEAAGAQVLVITATHRHSVHTSHPTAVDFNGLRATVRGRDEVTVESV